MKRLFTLNKSLGTLDILKKINKILPKLKIKKLKFSEFIDS